MHFVLLGFMWNWLTMFCNSCEMDSVQSINSEFLQWNRYRDVSWMKFLAVYQLSQNRRIVMLSWQNIVIVSHREVPGHTQPLWSQYSICIMLLWSPLFLPSTVIIHFLISCPFPRRWQQDISITRRDWAKAATRLWSTSRRSTSTPTAVCLRSSPAGSSTTSWSSPPRSSWDRLVILSALGLSLGV